MSSGPRKERAFPTNELDQDWQFFNDFGGMGGGGGPCPEPLGVDRVVIPIENNPFMVYYKFLVLELWLINLPYTDGGPTSDCDHSNGSRVPIYLAVSSNSTDLTEAEIKAQDNIMPTSWNVGDPALLFKYRDIKLGGAPGFIPQPTDPGYDGHTYVTVYWGSPNYVTTSGFLPIIDGGGHVRVEKEDYNEQI